MESLYTSRVLGKTSDSMVAAMGEVLHQKDLREFEISTKVDGLEVARGTYTAELLSAKANRTV